MCTVVFLPLNRKQKEKRGFLSYFFLLPYQSPPRQLWRFSEKNNVVVFLLWISAARQMGYKGSTSVPKFRVALMGQPTFPDWLVFLGVNSDVINLKDDILQLIRTAGHWGLWCLLGRSCLKFRARSCQAWWSLRGNQHFDALKFLSLFERPKFLALSIYDSPN